VKHIKWPNVQHELYSEDNLKEFGMAYAVFSLSLPEPRCAVNNVFVTYEASLQAEGQHS
jgi:hypothetical protein